MNEIIERLAWWQEHPYISGKESKKICHIPFEEMKCARREKAPEVATGFQISFVTVNETVDVFVPVENGAYQANYVYIGEYEFEPLVNGVDIFYFESIFAK